MVLLNNNKKSWWGSKLAWHQEDKGGGRNETHTWTRSQNQTMSKQWRTRDTDINTETLLRQSENTWEGRQLAEEGAWLHEEEALRSRTRTYHKGETHKGRNPHTNLPFCQPGCNHWFRRCFFEPNANLTTDSPGIMIRIHAFKCLNLNPTCFLLNCC